MPQRMGTFMADCTRPYKAPSNCVMSLGWNKRTCNICRQATRKYYFTPHQLGDGSAYFCSDASHVFQALPSCATPVAKGIWRKALLPVQYSRPYWWQTITCLICLAVGINLQRPLCWRGVRWGALRVSVCPAMCKTWIQGSESRSFRGGTV